MLSKEQLGLQLRDLGIGECRLLMVHASLRRLGPVAGGADGLLDGLMAALGSDGTLVMPMGADDSSPIDYRTTLADGELGVLVEIFRQRHGTRVNDHAAARFGASGPLANVILEPVPLHNYYGEGSPLSRFANHGGWVLRLAADIDTVTLTHWAEYLADLPQKRSVRRRYLRADIGEQWIESLDDTDGIADWSGGDYFSQILIDFLAEGKVRCGPVGKCQAELFSAAEFVPFAVHWLERNIR
ncbi:MAG: AAC(3) family N-acetyltransferase [Pseudomonadota bacterium]